MQRYTLEEFINLNTKKLMQSANFGRLKEIQEELIDNKAKNYCSQISMGILIRSKISPHNNELLTFFGDGNDINNHFALANWIYEQNPNQSSANSYDVDEYLRLYHRRLSDAGLQVDF